MLNATILVAKLIANCHSGRCLLVAFSSSVGDKFPPTKDFEEMAMKLFKT